MNLKKKKKMIARVLGTGVNRIILAGKEEIKEAITRQDIRELKKQGIIKIRAIKGRKKITRKKRKGFGSIKKKVKNSIRDVRLTRKLRNYVGLLRKRGKLSTEEYYELRKKIKARSFHDSKHISLENET